MSLVLPNKSIPSVSNQKYTTQTLRLKQNQLGSANKGQLDVAVLLVMPCLVGLCSL